MMDTFSFFKPPFIFWWNTEWHSEKTFCLAIISIKITQLSAIVQFHPIPCALPECLRFGGIGTDFPKCTWKCIFFWCELLVLLSNCDYASYGTLLTLWCVMLLSLPWYICEHNISVWVISVFLCNDTGIWLFLTALDLVLCWWRLISSSLFFFYFFCFIFT